METLLPSSATDTSTAGEGAAQTDSGAGVQGQQTADNSAVSRNDAADDKGILAILGKHKVEARIPWTNKSNTGNSGNEAAADGEGDDGVEGEVEGEEGGTGDEPAQVSAGKSTPLSAEHVVLAGRFQLKGPAVKALEQMAPEVRLPFLEHLQRTSKWADGKLGEIRERDQRIQELEAQLGARSTAAAKPAAEGEMSAEEKADLAELTEAFGEAPAKLLWKQAQRRNAGVTPTPQRQGENSAMLVMQRRDEKNGWSALDKAAPATLKSKLADPTTKNAIMGKAWQLIKARLPVGATQQDVDQLLGEYSLEHAIPEAAQLLHPTDYRKNAALELANKARRSLRGVPDNTGRPGATATRKSEDDEESERAEAAIRRHYKK